MIPQVAFPADVYEIDVTATGSPGARVDLRGLRVGDGPTLGTYDVLFLPLRRYVDVDGTGAALVTLICSRAGPAGALGPGAAVHVESGTPSGLTLYTNVSVYGARVSAASTMARQLARALGTSYNAADGTNNARDLAALGLLVALGRATNLDTLAECFPDSATRLLARWERVYGLPARPDRDADTRRARILAKVRAGIAGTPQAIASAIAALAGSATIDETTAVEASTTDPRAVFQWSAAIPAAAWDDPETLAAIVAIVGQMKPAHSRGSVVTRTGFRFGDADSLIGRDAF